MTSLDGIYWIARQSPEQNNWQDITFGNSIFVVVSNTGTNRVMTSLNGINWTARTMSEPLWLVAWGNGIFVAIGSRTATSTDGINWAIHHDTTLGTWLSIAFGNGIFVVGSVPSNGSIMTSTNGISWTRRNPPSGIIGGQQITFGGNMFISVEANNITTSNNGINWFRWSMPSVSRWNAVAFGNDKIVVVGHGISGVANNVVPKIIGGNRLGYFGEVLENLVGFGGVGFGQWQFERTGGTSVTVNTSTGILSVVGVGSSSFRVRRQSSSNWAMSSWSEIITITISQGRQDVPTIVNGNIEVYYNEDNISNLQAIEGNGNGAFEWAVTSGNSVSINHLTGAITINSTGESFVHVRRLSSINWQTSLWSEKISIVVLPATQKTPVILRGNRSAIYGDILLNLQARGGNGTGIFEFERISGTSVQLTDFYTGALLIEGVGLSKFRVRRLGDNNWNTSAWSDEISITVIQGIQPTPTILDDSFEIAFGSTAPTLTATGGTIGEWEWEVYSGTSISINSSTGAVTMNSVGVSTVRVRRLGGANWAVSEWSNAITVTVTQGNQQTVSIVGGDRSIAFGGTLSNLQASGGNGSGVFEFERVTGNSVNLLNSMTGELAINGVGLSTFRVRILGDANFATSSWSDVITITVTQANQSVVSILGGNQSTVLGSTISNLRATGGNGSGQFEWQVVSGVSILINSATGAVTINSVGVTTVRVRRLGDDNFVASDWSDTITITVTEQEGEAPGPGEPDGGGNNNGASGCGSTSSIVLIAGVLLLIGFSFAIKKIKS